MALIVSMLLIGSFASSLSRERQSQVEAVVRATILWPILQLHRASAERAAVGRRASALEEERDSLVAATARFRAVADQARDLRSLAGLEEPELGTVRTAEVYPGRPRVGDPDEFLLRGDRLSDLDFPVGVFTGRGLVGVARAPHGSGARGEFWSHTDFRVSVVTEDGAISGIARSVRRDEGQPVLLLEGAPYQADVVEGTRLVTTGIAGVYPPGIPIGTVREPASEEAGWTRSYWVEPAVRPAETRVVLVWDRPALDSLMSVATYVPPPVDSLAADSVAVPASSGSVAPPDSLGGTGDR